MQFSLTFLLLLYLKGVPLETFVKLESTHNYIFFIYILLTLLKTL